MAEAIEIFSIREYAANMRSISAGKCWPFACVGRDLAGHSLPPILLRKFRWWADELESGRGIDEHGAEIPAKVEACPATARASGRGKQKAPKKRSILELFEVSPQIDAVDEDDAEDAEERGEVLERGKRKVGFNSGGEVQVRNHQRRALLRKKNQKKPSKKLKKKKKIVVFTSRKVKSHSFKLPAAWEPSPISEYCSMKNKSKDPVGHHKKKKRAQILKAGKNLRLIGSLKFPGKKRNQDVKRVFPLRSILNNQISSKKKTSVSASSLRINLTRSLAELVKHVSFSDKDDVIGPYKKAAPVELPQSQTRCKVLFSDIPAESVAINSSSKGEKFLAAIERPQLDKENSDVSARALRWIDRANSEKNHCSATYGLVASTRHHCSSVCSDKDNDNSIENFDFDRNMQMHSDLCCPETDWFTSLHCHQELSNRQMVNYYYNEDLKSNCRNHSGMPAISCKSFPSKNSVQISDPTCSQELTTNPVMHPSKSCLVSTMENDKDSSHPSYLSNITERRPNCYLSSKYVLSRNCSSVSSMKLMEPIQPSDPLIFSREKIINEEIFGLPLNSQGELVILDSSHKLSCNHNTIPSSNHDSLLQTRMDPMIRISRDSMNEKFPSESFNAEDLLLTLPNQYCHSENQLTSIQDVPELQNLGGMIAESLEPVQVKDHYKISCNGSNPQNFTCQTNRLASHPVMNNRVNVSPPTMHLMGTTVTIGKICNKCQGFNDGKFWTDNKMTTEQCTRASGSHESYSDQWSEHENFSNFAPWASQDKLPMPSQGNPSLYHIPSVESNIGRACFNHQPQMPVGHLSTIFNHVPIDNNTALHCHPPQACQHLTQQQLVPCNSVWSIESVHKNQLVASASQDILHQSFLHPTHCKHTQSFSSSNSSMSNPLYRNYTHLCSVEPSSACSLPYNFHRLLNDKELLQGPIIPVICYHTPYVGSQSGAMPGANFLPHPLPYSKSLVALPVYNSKTDSKASGSSILDSFGRHYFGCSTNSPTSSTNSNWDGPKSKFAYLSAWNHGLITKKRLAEQGHEFIRPLKIANAVLPVGSKSIPGPAESIQQNMPWPSNIATTGALRHGNETRNPYKHFLGNKTDKYNYSMESSSKCHKEMMSERAKFIRGEKHFLKPSQNFNQSSSLPIYSPHICPVKLRAGAKHVLKPSKNIEQKSSRLIHSTIPLADKNVSSRFAVSDKNVEEIYSF